MVLSEGGAPFLAEKGFSGKYGNRTLRGYIVPLIAGGLLIIIAGVLRVLYALPLSGSFLWYAGVLFSFYTSGFCIVRLTRSRSGEFFLDAIHASALGVALLPVAYSLFRRIGHPELIFFFCAVSSLIWFVLVTGDYRRKQLTLQTSLYDTASVILLLFAVFVLLHLSHFTDVVLLAGGFKIRSSIITESDFHLGIINALMSSYPPVSPYASGTSLAYYHMNLHLAVEMLYRLTGMDTLRLAFFYFPLLYFLLLAGIIFSFVRVCHGPRWIALLTALLIFGSDLSFIPGFLGMVSGSNPWTITFYTTIWSLFTLNGYLPAVIILFLCVLYLKQYYEKGDVSLLVVFGFLAFSSYGFKSSMGLHIAAAAFLTGTVSMWLMEDKTKGALVCAVSLVAAAGMVINLALLRSGMGHNFVEWAPLNNFFASLRRLGIRELSWNYVPLFLLGYMIALLGSRIVLIPLADTVLKRSSFEPALFFILIFSLTGIILTDMIYLGTYSHTANNSVWFAVQGLAGAWLVVPYFLERIGNKKIRAVIALMLIVLAIPSTAQFLKMRFEPNYIRIDKDAMEVIAYLKNTPPESVVLHELNRNMPSLSSNFAGRSTVMSFFRSFITLHLSEKEFRQRLNDILLFFDSGDAGKRSVILDRYHVDYVYASRPRASVFETEERLSPVLENKSYVLFAVKR